MDAEKVYRSGALQKQAQARGRGDGLTLVGTGARLTAILSLLVSVAGLVLATVISIPVTVQGQGILLEATGVKIISADTDGRIVRMHVGGGDTVRAGQLIAEVAQADSALRVLDARQALQAAELERTRAREAIASTRSAADVRQSQRRESAERLLATEKANLERLLKRQAAQEKLAKDGFVSPMSLIDGEQDIIASRRRLDELREPLQDGDLERRTREADERQRLAEQDLRVQEARRQLADAEDLLNRTTQIRATHDGEVASVRVAEGDVVSRQSEVATLIPERNGKAAPLVAHFFVPGESGTQVRTGMTANVLPSALSPQEYGYIRGKVAQVSALPVGTDDLERLLRNRDLVQQIMQAGVPIQLEVELERGATPSGFQWTSSTGPSTVLGHGTQLSGRVEIRRERLITVVLPFLKRFFP